MLLNVELFKKDCNPVWDESFMIVIPDLSQNLEMKILNHNLMRDDVIGSHIVELTNLEQTTSEKVWNQNKENFSIYEFQELQLNKDDPQDESVITLSLNLLAAPVTENISSLTTKNTILFPSSSPGALRRRKEAGSSTNTNAAVLSLSVIEGRNLDIITDLQEVYLKFKYVFLFLFWLNFHHPGLAARVSEVELWVWIKILELSGWKQQKWLFLM